MEDKRANILKHNMAADPKALALAMAARLSATIRKREETGGGGPGQRFRKKIVIPADEYPDINFLGLLIGPRGSTQQRLQQDSGAKILIRGRGSSKDGNDEDPDQPLHVLVVAETEDQLKRGSEMVEDIVLNPENARRLKREQLQALGGGRRDDYGDRGRDRYEDQPKEEIKVPNTDVGLIIGRGGETINRLQRDFECRIQIARESAPGSPNRAVTISGALENIQRAREEIKNLMDSRRSARNDRPPLDKKTITVPGSMIGMIIGRGGESIRELRARTGARITVERDSVGPNREITLIGQMRQIEHAEHEIMDMVRQREQQGPPNRGGGGGFGRGGGRGGGGRGGGRRGRDPNEESGGVLNPHRYDHSQQMGYGMGYGYPPMGYPGYGYPQAGGMQAPPKPDSAYIGTPFYAQQVQAWEAYQAFQKQQEEMKKQQEKMQEAQKANNDNKGEGKSEGAGQTNGENKLQSWPPQPAAGQAPYPMHGYPPMMYPPYGHPPPGGHAPPPQQGQMPAAPASSSSNAPASSGPPRGPPSGAPPSSAPPPASGGGGAYVHPSRRGLVESAPPAANPAPLSQAEREKIVSKPLTPRREDSSHRRGFDQKYDGRDQADDRDRSSRKRSRENDRDDDRDSRRSRSDRDRDRDARHRSRDRDDRRDRGNRRDRDGDRYEQRGSRSEGGQSDRWQPPN